MEHIELFSYDEFLHEAKKAKIKRKYTDKHPETTVQFKSPIRNKILSFISEKTVVSKEDLVEFIAGMNEETGRKTSFDWIRRNSKMVKKVVENGNVSYKLTKFGSKVLAKTTISETDAATLQNTPGMGNVKAATKDEIGSGDIFDDEDEKKKKKKKKVNEGKSEEIKSQVKELIDDTGVEPAKKQKILKDWLSTISSVKTMSAKNKDEIDNLNKIEKQIKDFFRRMSWKF